MKSNAILASIIVLLVCPMTAKSQPHAGCEPLQDVIPNDGEYPSQINDGETQLWSTTLPTGGELDWCIDVLSGGPQLFWTMWWQHEGQCAGAPAATGIIIDESTECLGQYVGDDCVDAGTYYLQVETWANGDVGNGFYTVEVNFEACGSGPCATSACADGACEDVELCGNDSCDSDCGETSCTCPQDCAAMCGDGCCAESESCATCSADCGTCCPNGLCDEDETACNCPSDCVPVCGDGCCTESEDGCTCPQDCVSTCGDGCCADGESNCNCESDCPPVCGDGCCTGTESCGTCPGDCGDCCPNGVCDDGETECSCPDDCSPLCGDGCCTVSENSCSCPQDCEGPCGEEDCQPNGTPDDEELVSALVILEQTFSCGVPEAWALSGLWNLTAECGMGECDVSPWLYFGQFGSCNFDAGETVEGTVSLPELTIPVNALTSTLTYCSFYDGDRGLAPDGFDAAWVSVNDQIVDDVGPVAPVGAWETRDVDLSTYAGQTISLTWHFDSNDAVSNDGLGWQIDAIKLESQLDNDCDDNSVPDDCQPDCNENGVADVCDIAAGTLCDVNADGFADGCQCDPAVEIQAADPPSGTIDARQPTTLDCTEEVGIGSPVEPIMIDLGSENIGLSGCFHLCESSEDAVLGPNSIDSVADNGDGTYSIVLAHPLSTGLMDGAGVPTRTMIRYIGNSNSETSVSYVNHPGDVNCDGVAGVADVLYLIDILTEQSAPCSAPYNTDINHSGGLEQLKSKCIALGAC